MRRTGGSERRRFSGGARPTAILDMNLRNNVGLVIAIIVTGVTVPLLWYGAYVGRVPSIPTAKVNSLLAQVPPDKGEVRA